jgi:signal transduction histidine kinase
MIQSFVEKNVFRGSYIQIAEENEKLRQEILQTERLRSVATLASGMAHEIKNPLTVLKTFSEYLPQKLNDKEFLRKFAPMISSEVDRIDSLVHDLLDFAKPADPIFKRTLLYSLLDPTVELLSNETIKHQIHIHKEYATALDLELELDANQIKQALLNIFLNAIEAMPTGGELWIHTSLIKENKVLQLRIRDTGKGIPAEDHSHIFDPFFTKKDQGTGLGLSITHEIIKKHSGRILVKSQLGQGSEFTIELPIIRPF